MLFIKCLENTNMNYISNTNYNKLQIATQYINILLIIFMIIWIILVMCVIIIHILGKCAHCSNEIDTIVYCIIINVILIMNIIYLILLYKNTYIYNKHYILLLIIYSILIIIMLFIFFVIFFIPDEDNIWIIFHNLNSIFMYVLVLYSSTTLYILLSHYKDKIPKLLVLMCIIQFIYYIFLCINITLNVKYDKDPHYFDKIMWCDILLICLQFIILIGIRNYLSNIK